jgi:hypothetical protein
MTNIVASMTLSRHRQPLCLKAGPGAIMPDFPTDRQRQVDRYS